LPAAPAAAPVESIDEMRAKLLARISPALKATWPAEAPLSGFDLTLSDEAIALDVQYQGSRDLSPIAIGLIAKQLQGQLHLPTLVVQAHRLPASRDRRGESRTKAR
jgi:hypothetical protein